MNPVKEAIVASAIEKRAKQTDAILQKAFLKHFGFPLADAKYKDTLECVVVQGKNIKSYRYRGETFLLSDEGMPEIDGNKVTWTTRFVEV